MDDEEILLLTCEPGFSTAAEATKVSGRGVGMDVVKGKIEYLGGSLLIGSTPGGGSQFVLTLPLTLAIVQALLVSSGAHIFAIPLSAVSEVVPPDEMPLETVDGRPVVILRDRAVAPIYRLDVIVGDAKDSRRKPGEHEHVVLLESGEQIRALAVDRLIGREEVVIKPLSPMFKHLRGLGGATVLGDGTIALILDPRSFFLMGGTR
jgi:two-component system chemotaxis sensor kinase CheA